jgi:hypothetical protein
MTELDPTQRRILERELAEAEQERERIDGAIAYLRRRLGARVGDSGPYSVPLPTGRSRPPDPAQEEDEAPLTNT